ncbi:MAG: hypothetical protein ABI700_33060 [Chloroflexota bacterium]
MNEDIALVYIRLVEQESREAAGALELIRDAFGARAALRAAVMITILKMEVRQNHWIPFFRFYADLLKDYPAALPLTKYAALCCLQKWDADGLELEASGWAELAMARV